MGRGEVFNTLVIERLDQDSCLEKWNLPFRSGDMRSKSGKDVGMFWSLHNLAGTSLSIGTRFDLYPMIFL